MGDVYIVSGVAIEGCKGCIHVQAMLRIMSALCDFLVAWEVVHTLSRTLPKALNSSSTLVFSFMRSMSESLSVSTPLVDLEPEVGPEATVGVCISSMCNPIAVKLMKKGLLGED